MFNVDVFLKNIGIYAPNYIPSCLRKL